LALYAINSGNKGKGCRSFGRKERKMQELNREEIQKKLNLVVDKLLNLEGPDNEKELEEGGGEAIGFF